MKPIYISPGIQQAYVLARKHLLSSRRRKRARERETSLQLAASCARGESSSTSLFHKRIFMYREQGARSVLQIKKFSHLIPLCNEKVFETELFHHFWHSTEKKIKLARSPGITFYCS
jgi:hypothetical protein